jgi:acyl transferase domain-containing protein
MRHAALPPVMHLRDVNPYVESTLGDWGKKQGLAAAVPRQAAPAPEQSPGAGDFAVGTSSFGMSGVNSHVLLRPAQAEQLPLDEKPQL